MSMTVLQLVQEFCGEKTLPVPGAVVGATDSGVVQIRYLLAKVIRDLSEHSWEEQKIRKTWVTSAAQDQGALTTLFGADYDYLVPDTTWDLTTKLPIWGPVTPSRWAELQAINSGPQYQYIVLGGRFLMSPTPPAGHSMESIYRSKYGILSSGGTAKEFITDDTDKFLLPDNLVSKLLDIKWKIQKGEDATFDIAGYSSLLPKKLVKDTAPVLRLDGTCRELRPGVWVPAGNWPT